MDCDGFINEIRSRPEIWHLKHPDRKNKFKVMKKWHEVRRSYPEFTVDELKKRWKNLKDTYRKELKRLPQTRPGVPADNLKSGWRYFETLSFLRDELSFQGKEPDDTNCIAYTSPTPQEPEKYQPPYSEVSCPSPAPASGESSKSDEEAEKTVISKRKTPLEIREEFLRLEKKKMKILEEEIARNNEYTNSDNYHFLMSLLPEMDKLSPVQKMRLRTKISQAVLEEVSLSAPSHIFNEQPAYTEVHYQAGQLEAVNIIKEEAINMYD